MCLNQLLPPYNETRAPKGHTWDTCTITTLKENKTLKKYHHQQMPTVHVCSFGRGFDSPKEVPKQKPERPGGSHAAPEGAAQTLCWGDLVGCFTLFFSEILWWDMVRFILRISIMIQIDTVIVFYFFQYIDYKHEIILMLFGYQESEFQISGNSKSRRRIHQ